MAPGSGLSATVQALQRSAPLAGQAFLTAGFEQWQRWQAQLLAANSWWLHFPPLAAAHQTPTREEAPASAVVGVLTQATPWQALKPLSALAPVAPLLDTAERLWAQQLHTMTRLQGAAKAAHETQVDKLRRAQSEVHATVVQGLHQLANPRSNTLAPSLQH